jgi:hypothetical protein
MNTGMDGWIIASAARAVQVYRHLARMLLVDPCGSTPRKAFWFVNMQVFLVPIEFYYLKSHGNFTVQQ